MKKKKFIVAALNKKLTVAMLQEFCQDRSGEEIAVTFEYIIKRVNDEFDGYFNSLMRQLNNPEIMLVFVESLIPAHYISGCKLHLEDEDVQWIATDMDLDVARKILKAYLDKGYRFSDESVQEMIYKSSQPILFQVLVEYQEIGEALQKRLFTELACSCDDEAARARQLAKIEAYILKHRLCAEAEVEMVRRPEKELAKPIESYAFKWGFCPRVMSGLLWQLKRRIG